MSTIRSVCVYCGSGPGTDAAFIAAALRFGELLAKARVRLVYGGGSKGLMGAVASAVIEHGGEVTGIIPEFLKTKEGIQTAAQEIIVTPNMHVRKQTMFERADAFVALPGGIGTLEELVEQLTWAQLGRHPKPILMANIKGFWDPLLDLIRHMQQFGFVHSPDQFRYLITDTVDDIIPLLNKTAQERASEQVKTDLATLRKL
jgi:uncharacterized protein (TIGR00730 family)